MNNSSNKVIFATERTKNRFQASLPAAATMAQNSVKAFPCENLISHETRGTRSTRFRAIRPPFCSKPTPPSSSLTIKFPPYCALLNQVKGVAKFGQKKHSNHLEL